MNPESATTAVCTGGHSKNKNEPILLYGSTWYKLYSFHPKMKNHNMYNSSECVSLLEHGGCRGLSHISSTSRIRKENLSKLMKQ